MQNFNQPAWQMLPVRLLLPSIQFTILGLGSLYKNSKNEHNEHLQYIEKEKEHWDTAQYCMQSDI